MSRICALGLVLSTLILLPHGVAGAQSATLPPTQFALTLADFPTPGQIIVSQVESNDAATADPRVLHLGAKSFADENRVTGYFMDVAQLNLDAAGNARPVFTRYLVSTFNSEADATAAFVQQRDGWEQLVTDPTSPVNGGVVDLGGQKFGDQQGRGLYQGTATSTDGPVDVSELVFRRGVYVVEVWQVQLHSLTAQFGAVDLPFVSSIGTKLDGIASGAAAVSPAPTPRPAVDFSLLAVRFEKNRAKVDLKGHGLRSVRVGSTVQMSIYFAVKSAPSNASMTTEYTLSAGGRSMHRTFKHTLGVKQSDYYRYALYNVQLPRTGTYTFTGAVTIGKVTKRGTVSMVVTR